jgi:tRNA pseudouridine38-40 synthase
MARKRNLRITVEYDGTRYHGWQLQKDRITVQGELQRALKEITGRRIPLVGAGRTDAGVHAEGQVANFHTESRIPARKWPEAINAHLPDDIAVVAAEEVPLDFHAQYAAVSKIYRYRILNRHARCALDRDRVHRVKAPLKVDLMREGAALLVGMHDYRAFGSEMSRKEKTVRTIHSFSVDARGKLVEFLVHGDGFLYNQVRAMVGTLVIVGTGRRPPGWVGEVLRSRDRSQAGANLPAKGLTLVEVRY